MIKIECRYFWNLWKDTPGGKENLPACLFASDVSGLIEKAKQDYREHEKNKQKVEEEKTYLIQEIEQLGETVQQKQILQAKAGFERGSLFLSFNSDKLRSLTILKPFVSERLISL